MEVGRPVKSLWEPPGGEVPVGTERDAQIGTKF